MDKIGFWKLAEVMRFDENFNRSWQKVEDVMADESLDDSDKNILATVMELTPDGRLLLMMPLPEGVTQEQIDEALASGELKLHENGMMIYETHPWKEEDGKLMYDTGTHAEVLGEVISSWDELAEEDGFLRMLMYRFVRM